MTNELKPEHPLIHLNGTSAESLADAIEEAYTKLGEAYDALRQLAPNARDYYPKADYPTCLQVAENKHRNRLEAIDEMRTELEELVHAINNQKRGR